MKSPIARKYARALLEVAKNEGKMDEVFKGIEYLEGVLKKEVIEFLSLPTVSFEEKSRLLLSIEESGVHPFITRTLSLMIEKNRAPLIPDLLYFYRQFYMQEKGYIVVEVNTARELKDFEIDLLKERLEEFVKGKVYLQVEIHPELIGGIVMKIGDLLVDNSVKKKLEIIRENMKGVRGI